MGSNPIEPVWQAQAEYLVQPSVTPTFAFLGVCSNAQTLSAYSLTHRAFVVFALPCRMWSCRLCAETKIKKLAGAVRTAKPTRLLTLTVDPSLHETPKEAWESTRKKVPILIRKLREKFGEVEYLRVTEVTKRGWPHYHLLVRSGYLPQQVVKMMWNQLTGARIVDLRKVHKTFYAYTYLVKYLSKLHRLEWTNRHVSVSRGFFPPETWEPDNQFELEAKKFSSGHPAFHIAETYQGATLERLSSTAFLVKPKELPHDNLSEIA